MNTIRLVNHSSSPYRGWLRTNIDWMPPHRVGLIDEGVTYVVGPPTGLDTRSIDLQVDLPGGGLQTKIDLSKSKPINWQLAPLPDLSFFGGLLSIASVPMALLYEPLTQGACYVGHFQARVGPMLLVNLWLRWNPDQPELMVGSCCVVASNPAVQNVVATVPVDFTLRFGDAVVFVPGRPAGAPLLDAGDWLADGQPRVFPISLLWLRHAKDYGSLTALLNLQVQQVGLNKLHHCGNPVIPDGFDPLLWTNQLLPESVRRLHTWEQPVWGPNLVSADTGAQGGQSFVAGQPMLDPSALPVIVLNAMQPRWPFAHCEQNGQQLDYTRHRGLYLWNGRVNRQMPSMDDLGKLSEPSAHDKHFTAGPDTEHWFNFTLFGATRYTGDPALQWLLSAHARCFLFTWNLDPAWWFAARAVGWCGYLAAELYRGLADRALAEAVKARYIGLVEQVFLPYMAPDENWMDYRSDPRIEGTIEDPVSILWQVAVLAGGTDYACEVFGHDAGRKFAYHCANEIVSKGYKKEGDKWIAIDAVSKLGRTWPTNKYFWFGMPMAVCTVLRHFPDHPKANSIMQQMRDEGTDPKQTSWLIPGV